ncbi:MAG: hypothetical protein LBU65_15210 [Planctomycetaceae bacterium]|jgi:hypothetical protein|nr:hypothetical protein [Planctomycetaceae bacterium]
MSEYQYYYFESIDKPLTDEEQQELPKISTRAEINSRRFVNKYQWGDLKTNPKVLMEKYFDVHLYYANWGTRIIMFKVPAKSVDFDLMKQYETEETLRITKKGVSVIIDITADVEENEEWWKIETEIKKFISLRDDLIAGDYRCLYIAWLAQNRNENKGKYKIPPVPAKIKKLTETLRSFADFMYLDSDTLTTAVQSAGTNALKEPTFKEIKTWVTELPEKDKQKFLIYLLQEKESVQNIQRNLRKRFLDDRKK